MTANRQLLQVLSASIVAATVSAGIVPVSQSRSVGADATATVGGITDIQSDSAAAPDFSLFDEQVAPLAVAISGSLVAIGQGVAGQTSEIGLQYVTATGQASTSITLVPAVDGSAETSASSLFDFEFTLAVPSTYSLTGLVDTSAVVTGGASVPGLENGFIFEDVGNSIVLFEALTNDETFSVSGLLPAGTYRLTASASVDASQTADRSLSRTVAGLSAFELALRVQAIPESGSMGAVLGLGLAGGLAWRSRLRRN